MMVFNIRLMKTYFKENKHTIIINIIGMTFIVMILTVIVLSDISFKMTYVNKEINSKGKVNFEVIRDFEEKPTVTRLNSNVAYTKEYILKKAESHGLKAIISDPEVFSVGRNVELFDIFAPKIIWPKLFFQSANRSILEEMGMSSQFQGRLPSQPNEVIYYGIPFIPSFTTFQVINEIEEFIQLGKELNVTMFENQNLLTYNLTIVGKYIPIRPVDIKTDSDERVIDPFVISHPHLVGQGLCTEHQLYQQLISPIANENVSLQISSEFTLSLINHVNYFTLEEVLEDVKQFSTDIGITDVENNYYINRFKPATNYYQPISSIELVELYPLRNELHQITIISLLAMVPNLLVTLFLTQYSSRVFKRSYEKRVGIFRLRGINSFQLLVLISIEGGISFFLAGLGGVIIGAGLTKLILTLPLSTRQNRMITDIPISLNLIQTIFMWSFLFTSFLIYRKMRTSLKVDLSELSTGLNDLVNHRGFKWGIPLLLMGIIGNIFLYIIFFQSSSIPGYTEVIIQVIMVITAILFLPFPLFLLIGGILTMSYLIMPIVTRISKKAWYQAGNLFAYSLISITRVREKLISAILINALVISLFWLMFTLPVFLHTNITRTTYYSIGADCYYSHPWNTSLENTLQADPNIANITPMGICSFPVSEELTFKVIIIASNFLDVAYYESSFGSIQAIETLLTTPSDQSPYPVLMNKKGLDILTLESGDTIFLSPIDKDTFTYFQILGSFTYWPRLIRSFPSYASPSLVLTNTTFVQLVSTDVFSASTISEAGYYFKLSPTANITQLKETYGNSLLTVAQEHILRLESLGAMQILRLHLNIMAILSCITFFFIIFLNGFHHLRERSRELAVERALGMKLPQLSKLFFYEALSILAFSFMIGTIFGVIFTTSFLSILVVLFKALTFLPPLVSYPVIEINAIIAIFFTIGLIASIFPALVARKANLNIALRTF